MSKLIDADKVKEAISEKTVATRKTERNWYKNALEMMELVDNQPAVLLSCPKCHGKGVYDAAVYNESGEIIGWNPTLCEVCKGTGKISLAFYEDLQRGCRR